MRQPNQILIFNDKQLELIKSTFADNEEILYLIRKVLLQFPMTDSERKLVKSIMTQELYEIIKLRIFPEISNDMPLGQIGDIYQTLTSQLSSKTVDEMSPLFEAKILEIEYLTQQFNILKDIETDTGGGIRLDMMANLKGKTDRQRYVETTARNFILGFIDPMLIMIKNIAGQKTETIEETKKRITRNSNQ